MFRVEHYHFSLGACSGKKASQDCSVDDTEGACRAWFCIATCGKRKCSPWRCGCVTVILEKVELCSQEVRQVEEEHGYTNSFFRKLGGRWARCPERIGWTYWEITWGLRRYQDEIHLSGSAVLISSFKLDSPGLTWTWPLLPCWA